MTLHEVLLGEKQVPKAWLSNVAVFLPKIPLPCLPKHLRPEVPSSCMAKPLTKALPQRMRRLRCGQLRARTGGQVLDGALAAQQLTYVAAQYSLPLLFLKLDIAAAFDSVEHPAVARFSCSCQPLEVGA